MPIVESWLSNIITLSPIGEWNLHFKISTCEKYQSNVEFELL